MTETLMSAGMQMSSTDLPWSTRPVHGRSKPPTDDGTDFKGPSFLDVAFGGTYCETAAPSLSCGGTVQIEEAVSRFEVTIRQTDSREKQCNYQLTAPPGKKILINMLRIQGRCVEGCWVDGAEFKMLSDYRPLGYSFCCSLATQRRLLSKSDVVPLIVTSRNATTDLIFKYTYVDTRTRFDAEVGSTAEADLEVLESMKKASRPRYII